MQSLSGVASRTHQWGKSTTCAIKAVHYAHFHPESLVIVASPSLRQSGEFVRKARKAVTKLGSPEREDTIPGFSEVGLLIVDEASRVSDEMYFALRPMLAVGAGSIWLMSTLNGQSGFFYREWSGKGNWTRIRAIAEECPRIPQEFLQEERETLGEEVYRREYCCEFVAAEGALFDEPVIRSKFTDKLAPLW